MMRFNGSKHGMLVSLIILILMWLCEFSSVVDAKKHVRITNELAEGLTLTIHCKSKDNDLGVHQLAYNTYFEWSFHENIWGTTLFFCNIQWLHGNADFDAYDAKRSDFACDDCKWFATTDALYFVDSGTGESVLYYAWPPPAKP
ncbi:hypothetical protein NE237_016951 [Protea cynaroides]|uniref:S-protein homolog n=1 Tax=Protea cynaroides TaxID=273540 RepID=A0A9Q0K6P9_9MAGN|nr:hypothetical protein NE237_016951 [Protea cynaroides]